MKKIIKASSGAKKPIKAHGTLVSDEEDNIVTQSEIEDDISFMVEDIFLKYQDRLGITSGDIQPLDSLDLDGYIERLASTILRVLEYEVGMK